MNIRGFAALAKMHRFRMDEHRRKASEMDALRVRFTEQDGALEQELLWEKANLAPGDLATTNFAAYLKGVEGRRAALAKSIVDVTRSRSRVAEQMAIEFREVKKFELALERENKRRRDHAAKLEQAELDEIGLTYHDRAGM
ncbi:MAG: flagellar FliJ family protein [Alphaproteobacteria bacterium]|jgi:hypothetical protein